tara:strand:+ start:71257 stop:72033 length:777 start_codon:yes stop_codon:yes gene_type:complete
MINFLSIKIKMGITGFESPASAYVQRPLSLHELLITSPSSTSIEIIQGDYLSKIGLFNGDLLFINQYLRPNTGDIVFCSLNGEIKIRLIDVEQQLLISSELVTGRVIETPIRDEDDFVMLGVGICSIRIHDASDNRFHEFTLTARNISDAKFDLDKFININPQSTYFAQASGHSMEGAGIFDKDLIIVDRSLSIRNNSLIVCNLNEEFVCKFLDTKNRLLVSASAKHKPIPIRQNDTFNIEGSVPMTLRMLRSIPQLK